MIRCLAAVAAVAAAAVAAAPPGGTPRWAVAVLPSGHEFSLEIAADPESRARGYMGRDAVPERTGMLFIFDEDGRPGFWMKDCKVSLDMVWLDAGLRVVFVAADRHPCPAEGECPTVWPPVPARYVLELAAGTAARERLAVGDDVVILAEPPLR